MEVDSPAPLPPRRPRKARIPKALRVAVWDTYVGKGVGTARCPVCGVAEITAFTFHCGHVVAESAGGPTTLDNLRPVCTTCNLSMGRRDMRAFRAKFFA